MLTGMTIDDVRDAAHTLADLAHRHGEPLLFGAGATGALLALVLVWRFLRTGHAHTKLGRLAVALATLFAMEGMFEVAHGPLGLNTAGSLMFCATFEVVMLHQGSLAAHKLAAAGTGPAPDISRHMRFVWLVAVASGVIASTASDSLTEVVLRLVTPPLAAGIWYMSLYAEKPAAERQPSRWIWTPQRIGVRLGLLKPGTVEDLSAVFRQKRIAALVDAGVKLYAEREAAKLHGDQAESRRWWQRDQLAAATRRLQQLAKTASNEDVQAAQAQLRLTFSIEDVLLGQPSELDAWTQEHLARTAAGTGEAVRKLRTQVHHASLHGLVTPARREPRVQIGDVLLPAHIAAQIGPAPEPTGEPVRTAPAEPVREPVERFTDEPARDPAAGSPQTAPAAHAPAQRRVTERVTKPATTDTAKRVAQAQARLTKRLKREPTNPELVAETGLSLATVKRWKPTKKES